MKNIWGGYDNKTKLRTIEKVGLKVCYKHSWTISMDGLWMDFPYSRYQMGESWQNLSGFDCVAFTLLMARSQSIFSAQVRVEKWWSPKLKQLQSMPTRSLTPEFFETRWLKLTLIWQPGVTPWFPHWVHHRCWYRLRGEPPAPEGKKTKLNKNCQHISPTIAKICKNSNASCLTLGLSCSICPLSWALPCRHRPHKLQNPRCCHNAHAALLSFSGS